MNFRARSAPMHTIVNEMDRTENAQEILTASIHTRIHGAARIGSRIDFYAEDETALAGRARGVTEHPLDYGSSTRSNNVARVRTGLVGRA